MTPNQTIDGDSWFRRLFSKAHKKPARTSSKIGPSIFLPCGFRIGDSVTRCSSTSCAICNPMTRERAAQINQRYLQEKGYDQPND